MGVGGQHLQAAYALREAIHTALTDYPELPPQNFLALLELAAPATLLLEPGYWGGMYRLRFQSPSLLSALAIWAYADIIADRAFPCRYCGKLHASPLSRSIFCSRACQQTYSRRKLKAKKRAKELQAEGMNAMEIARTLKYDNLDEITGWLAEAD